MTCGFVIKCYRGGHILWNLVHINEYGCYVIPVNSGMAHKMHTLSACPVGRIYKNTILDASVGIESDLASPTIKNKVVVGDVTS